MAALNSSSIATAWRTLVAENPMAIEVSRFRRRFLEGGRGKGLNTTILVLAIIAYAGLLLVVANVAGDLPPGILIMAQTLTFVLIAPALMYSAIAGEREKRTWDLLLAAPVTHAQIIVGKFLAGVAGIGTAFVLFLVPTIFTAITYKGDLMYRSGYVSYSYDDSHVISGTMALINEEIISITFALLVLAATLLFSARCRRSLMSLGIVLTSLFLGLLAFPALVEIVSFGERGGFAELLNFFHPFMAIERLEEARRSYSSSFDSVGPGWYGIPQGVLYLFLTGVFLVWAYKTVDFADGEKKFIPRKPNA